MRLKLKLFVFITIIAFVFNCSKSDEPYTIETIDGVKHVHNHAPLGGDTLKVSLEFVKQIGEFDSEDENYLFFQPFDVAKDSVGNIYVADMGNYRIQKFDSTGNYLATFGRKGQGPSEFSTRPHYLDLNYKGEIYVTGADLTQWYILNSDGKEKKRFKFSERGHQFRVSNSGNIVISYSNQFITYDERSKKPIKQVKTYNSLIGVFDIEGNLIKEFGKPIDFGDEMVSRIANRNYIEIDPDDNLYLTFQYKNLIEKYSPEGKLLIKIDYPVEYEKSYKWNVQKLETGRMIFEMHLPDFPSFSMNIGVDHKKRIWIIALKEEKDEQNLPSYSTELYIFSNEGILLGKLTIPEKISWMRIFQDRMYLIDSFEEMCVYEYKIVEK